MASDLDDLLGAPTPPRRSNAGRPTREEQVARLKLKAQEQAEAMRKAGVKVKDDLIDLPDVAMFFRPVGVKFLAEVFRMEQRTVHKKLMKAPVVEWTTERGRTVPKWDFVVAAGFLVKPKIDLIDYLSSLNSNNIPPHLNKMFWDAKLAKQRWEERAKHTWKDEDVLAVLGDVAITVKDTAQLWIENLPGKDQMTSEQYETLTASVGGLLDEITSKLVKMPSQRRTLSTVTELDEEEVTAEEAMFADEFDDEDAAA